MLQQICAVRQNRITGPVDETGVSSRKDPFSLQQSVSTVLGTCGWVVEVCVLGVYWVCGGLLGGVLGVW